MFDKVKFLFRLQEMFPSLKERSFESIKQEYETVLTGEIDYQKLFKIFCTEWDSKSRPMASELKKYVQRAKIKETSELTQEALYELKNVAKWFNSTEYQWHRKAVPENIKMAINKYRFTDEMINRMMISEDLYESKGEKETSYV